MESGSTSRRRRRLWRFAGAEFDEASWTLRVGGQPMALEGKPLEVLHELLLRAGEVVTKEELFDAVWPGVVVVENSLATAVSKLRKVLGDSRDAVIETVPRIGYRLAGPVAVESLEAPLAPRFAFAADDIVPGRAQWRLVSPLGQSGAADVWRARHEKTGETRVFKFADAPDRLRALKREATLARLLMTTLGKDAPFVPLLEWNFERTPYFLESADGGDDLAGWAAMQGGIGAVPLEARLGLAAAIARALGAAHSVGVLHKDLKPANVLVEVRGEGPFVRLADFGSARLIDTDVLGANSITDFGVGLDNEDDSGRSGTLAYRAPELAGDGMPTMQSDVYAVGLILFQLVAGDFGRFLAPGWEESVGDPLLREDIALAAAADPARRPSASELAERLSTLDARRARAAESARLLARAEELAKAEERRRHRRPWVRAAAAAAVIGLAGISTMAVLAVGQRDRARTAQARAEASYAFLAEDILASPDPSRADAADERLVDVVRRASNGIDRRFAHTPLVAARLYATLARAFDQRSEYGIADNYYRRAAQWFARAGAGDGEEANIMRLQRASAEALSTRAGSLDRARALVAEARRSLGPERAAAGEPAVWLESAEGMIALAGEDIPKARDHSGRAAALADALPDLFDERQRLNLHQRHAFTLLRLGDPDGAARELTPLVATMSRLRGRDHPDTLILRLNLAQAKANSGHYEAALADLTPLVPLLESRVGPTHRLTLLALSVRQLSLGSLGRYREAALDAERVWRAAAAKDGPSSFTAAAMRSDLGTTQCRAGDYARGEENTRAAYRAARAAHADESALAQAIRAAIADCLIASGKAREAAPLLRNIDRERVNQLVGDAHWDASLDVSLAEVALAKGDHDEAKTRLNAAAAVYTNPPSDRYLAQRLDRLHRALGI